MCASIVALRAAGLVLQEAQGDGFSAALMALREKLFGGIRFPGVNAWAEV